MVVIATGIPENSSRPFYPFHRLIPGPSSSNSIPSYSVHAPFLISLLHLVISQRLGKQGISIPTNSNPRYFRFWEFVLKPSQFLHQPRSTRVHPCLQYQHFSLSARRSFSVVLTIPSRTSFSAVVNRHLSTFLWWPFHSPANSLLEPWGKIEEKR